MEQERYIETQQQILLMARVVLDMPLREFIEAAGRADAIGPILDPTLWHKGNKNLTSFMILANGLETFQTVAKMESSLIRALAAQVAAAGGGATTSADEECPLSEREVEVLQAAATGEKDKEIAKRLGISHMTVRHHMTNIHRKLGVQSRLEAVLWAVKRGMVEL